MGAETRIHIRIYTFTGVCERTKYVPPKIYDPWRGCVGFGINCWLASSDHILGVFALSVSPPRCFYCVFLLRIFFVPSPVSFLQSLRTIHNLDQGKHPVDKITPVVPPPLVRPAMQIPPAPLNTDKITYHAQTNGNGPRLASSCLAAPKDRLVSTSRFGERQVNMAYCHIRV